MPQKKRVMIIEDDEHTRARLCDAIELTSDYILVGFYGTLREGQIGLTNSKPDLLLIDLGLPDGNGIELIRFAVGEQPNLKIMVISVFGDERHVIEAIEAGAQGYLLKDADLTQLTDAMDQLIAGGSPITPSVAIYLLKRFQNSGPNLQKSEDVTIPVLTKREQDVLQLIARGLTYIELSETLKVSVNTIRVHMKNLFRKLAVTSRSEAVFEAVEKGILRMR